MTQSDTPLADQEHQDSLLTEPASPWRRRARGMYRLVLDNPVVRKELRGRMRGRRAFVVLTVYLLLLACFTTVLYYAYAAAAQQPYGPDSYLIGKIVFGGVLAAQVFLVIFITPAFTAGTLSGERERQTYDLLRTTLLSAPSLVAGKLIASLSYVILLIMAAIPLESLAFLLGGVTWEEVLISQLLLLVTALALGAASTYFSSRVKTTLPATVLSYGFAFLITAGLPIVLSIVSPILGVAGAALVDFQEPPWLIIVALVYIGGLIVSTNPLSAIILTELVLIEEQTIFFFKISIPSPTGSPSDIWLVSPWVVYVLFYGLVALLGYWLSVRRVRRTDR